MLKVMPELRATGTIGCICKNLFFLFLPTVVQHARMRFTMHVCGRDVSWKRVEMITEMARARESRG